MPNTIVAFDGLSLSGKSTMVQMSHERSENAEIVRENIFDPHRPTTSRLNKLLKELDPVKAVRITSDEFPKSAKITKRALKYSNSYSGKAQIQALLAFMFTAGRAFVDTHVREVVEEKDVILDRWQLTGWAYQAQPGEYSWQEIRELNQDFEIITPGIQFLLTCPIEQIPIRRAYRQKKGVGTAGQMSMGREDIILPAFLEIYGELKIQMPIYMIENSGIPAQELDTQIKQAIPTYQKVEDILRLHGFNLKEDTIEDPITFWTERGRLQRIYERQITKK